MHPFRENIGEQPQSRTLQLRAAVLLSFCEPLPMEFRRLHDLSGREWDDLLTWLDTSGLALYFLDRIEQCGVSDSLPSWVIVNLRQKLADNTVRTNAMIASSNTIQRSFQAANVRYVVLKGVSLWPMSVPKLECRSQLDLDFLVAEADAGEARRILEERGYCLHAISGTTWEFKGRQGSPRSLKDLYHATHQPAVELHVEGSQDADGSRLSRQKIVWMNGCRVPVLSPIDLFLWQGMHLCKHIRSGSVRAAHLLEFRRHILARFHDDVFWKELRLYSEEERGLSVGLGLVTLLITRLMGPFAPQAFRCWTADVVPDRVQLWIDLYGAGTVFADFPGNKLYLLLQKEMPDVSGPLQRSVHRVLVPNRLPPAIECAAADESFWECLRRYQRQCAFVLFRLRFHCVEGVRFLREWVRWRRCVRQQSMSRDGPIFLQHPDNVVTRR